jgi:hypothetical protein
MENTKLTNTLISSPTILQSPMLRPCCREILKTGKNKGKRCGSWKIYCGHRCLRHHQMAMRNGSYNNSNGDYGNPEQAHLWVQWVNRA